MKKSRFHLRGWFHKVLDCNFLGRLHAALITLDKPCINLLTRERPVRYPASEILTLTPRWCRQPPQMKSWLCADTIWLALDFYSPPRRHHLLVVDVPLLVVVLTFKTWIWRRCQWSWWWSFRRPRNAHMWKRMILSPVGWLIGKSKATNWTHYSG